MRSDDEQVHCVRSARTEPPGPSRTLRLGSAAVLVLDKGLHTLEKAPKKPWCDHASNVRSAVNPKPSPSAHINLVLAADFS